MRSYTRSIKSKSQPCFVSNSGIGFAYLLQLIFSISEYLYDHFGMYHATIASLERIILKWLHVKAYSLKHLPVNHPSFLHNPALTPQIHFIPPVAARTASNSTWSTK